MPTNAADKTVKHTFCRICEAGCGLNVETEGERVLKITPDRDHVVSQGYACVKGIRYDQVHHSDDRVTTPLKRAGDGFLHSLGLYESS